MYDEEPEEYLNTGAEIDENLKMFQRKGEKFTPKDTLFVFMGHEFLYLDYKKDTWNMSDVHYISGQPTFTLPQNASIVQLDPKVGICKEHNSHVFVLGGVNPAGFLLDWCYGVEFFNDTDVAG